MTTGALIPALIASCFVGGTTLALRSAAETPRGSHGSTSVVETTTVEQDQPDPLVKQRTKGDSDAPLVMYEMSDFQCPACKGFAYEILPDLEDEYIATGKLQLVFVNLPLVQLHPNAAAAHEFAMCAAKQDRFWPVHDQLFRYQEAWANSREPVGFFMMIADSAGLDKDSMLSCIETGELRWLVQQEATAVAQRGIRSTPSFIIEQLLIPGYLPMEEWRPLLDSLYAVKTGGN